jgi:uroporphyrinogen III methyltransferase / synthase
MKKGHVFLVGAGPGDAGLITVKGMKAIKSADVILYDRLANPRLLEQAPARCELVYCGKLPDRHFLRQEAINSLLVEKALEGKVVVRLKGGDPGVFGRVGEEAQTLSEHGISYDIVPGITSGMAAPLYAGIPATHREFGESFAMVTAHDKSVNGQPDLQWESLAKGIDTIAFYMGIANLPFICENLILHGKPAETPVILIRWGTFGRQQTLEGTLATIAQKAKAVKFANPAITLVGDIVSLRKKLDWFEKKPLFGRQILLVRTGTNESGLARELSSQGADVIEFPRWTRIKGKPDEMIVNNLSSYERIVFTSPESVADFFEDMIQRSVDIRQLKAKLYGGSSKSVRALADRGLLAESAEKLGAETGEDSSLLVVGDRSVRQEHTNGDFYETSTKEIDGQFTPILERMLEEAEINTVVFPSAASVKVLLEEDTGSFGFRDLLEKAELACLGVITQSALRERGYEADVVSDKADKESLAASLAQSKKWFGR